jgi:hypothetical protein
MEVLVGFRARIANQLNDGEPIQSTSTMGAREYRTGDGPGWPCIGVRGGRDLKEDLAEFQNL